jgi:type II secretory pathway pseudopilin PulG
MESGNNKHGTTLVEILVVMAVIMILAGLTAGIGTTIDRYSKGKAIEGTFALLEAALDEYRDFSRRRDYPPATNTDPQVGPYENCETLYRALNSVPESAKVLEKLSDKAKKDQYLPAVVPPAYQITYEIYDPWGTVLNYIYDPDPVSGHTFPKLTSAGPDKTFLSGDDITNR